METILDWIRATPGYWGLLIIFGTAGLEYVVPIIPGDTVLLFGALLIVAGRWTAGSVTIAAVAGGLLGAALSYSIGRWLGQIELHRLSDSRRHRILTARQYVKFMRVYRRYGDWVILANRFLPGIRGFVFYAAGMARLPLHRVLVLAGISAAAWSGLLLAAGYALGANWDRLVDFLYTYYRVASAVIVGALLLAALVLSIRRARLHHHP